jgi:exonuclease SbcC
MSAVKLEFAPKNTPVDWALVSSCAQHLDNLYEGSAAAQDAAATHLLTDVFDPFSRWTTPSSATVEQLLSLFRLSQALAELSVKDAKDADDEVLARDDIIKKLKIEEKTLRLQIKELNEENEEMAEELKRGGSSSGVNKSERIQLEQEIEQLRRKLNVAVELSEKERSSADAVRVDLEKCMRDLKTSEDALDKFKRDAEQNRMRLEMEREDAQTKEDRAREQQMKLRQQSKDTLRHVKELEALSKKHQELLDDKVKVDAQLIEYSREVVNLNQDLEVARVALLEAEQQLVVRTREVDNLRLRSKDVTLQMSRRDEEDQRRLQEMNQQISAVKQVVEQERQQNKEMKLAITRLRGENERLKLESSADHMRQKVLDLERNLEQLQSKLQNSQADCLTSHLACDQLKKSLEEANRKVTIPLFPLSAPFL